MAWWESDGTRMHADSDMELDEAHTRVPVWLAGAKPSPYLPWKETPEEKVRSMSLFEFFHQVHYHGGQQPWLSWWGETGKEPSRLPVVLLQPTVKLKETEGFARSA